MGRLLRPSLLPFHPLSPSNLIPHTTKGRRSQRVRRWWKEEKPTPPRRLSTYEGLSNLGCGKREMIGGVML